MTPQKPRPVPYAVGSFEKLREGNYFYTDKTAFIRELEAWQTPVFLRPRRFGKSLWCSILECYYDVKRKDAFETLFGDLDIGRNPTPERNSFLILRLDFSVVEVKPDLEYINKRFHEMMRTAFEGFLTYYGSYFEGLTVDLNRPAASVLDTIQTHIERHRLPRLYILIDEYDNFANQLVVGNQDQLYQQLTSGEDSFFRTFFKTIKKGVGMGSVGRVYITGVLPITMDDLTSGYNIAEVVTLKSKLVEMLGFTEEEVLRYLCKVIQEYNIDPALESIAAQLLKVHYNGYTFSADGAPLYNSTSVTYFLKDFALEKGKIPIDLVDPNLRTDLRWIKRLTLHKENTEEMLETLLLEGGLPYDSFLLRSKFNMHQFFEKPFYPVSLYYLGMLTPRDAFEMRFPNQSMKLIFSEYYNELLRYPVSLGYTECFRHFVRTLDLEKLFAGYWEVYISQLPAQIFDKMNENFFRTTFFELCTRHLSHLFTFAIEANRPSGRSDWELQGKPGTEYAKLHYVMEFKYWGKGKGKKVLEKETPDDEDKAQALGYVRDLKGLFPEYEVKGFVLYIVGNEGFRLYAV